MSRVSSELSERRAEVIEKLGVGAWLVDSWISGKGIPATLFRNKLKALGFADDWGATEWEKAAEQSAAVDTPDLGQVSEPSPQLTLLEHYERIDAELVKAGWPATSPWWRQQVERYFTSTVTQVVFRVGRRGGKSSTLCRIAVVEALHGKHAVPPGDTGFVAFVSVSRDEAAERLRTISDILDVLKVDHHPRGASRIDLLHKPIAFRVFAASVGGVSGFTCICLICDEVAKWKDMTTGVNPATEVLASARPTLATMPNAKILLSSSPLGELDAHAAAYSEGDSDFQFVAWAPTWIAHPALTEEETRKREPNELRWRREYGAIPLEGTEDGVFTSYLLDRATRDLPRIPYDPELSYVAWMDPATRGNAWTFAIATRRWVGELGSEICKGSIVTCCEWQGTPSHPLDPEVILAKIAAECRQYGIEAVHSDQHHADSLRSIGRRVGILVIIDPSTDRTKMTRYEGLSERLACGEIEIPPDKQLRADLLAVTRHLTPNGFTIRLPTTGDGRHADYAPTVAGALGWRLLEPERPKVPILTAGDRAKAEAARLNAFAAAHWAKLNERAMQDRREAANAIDVEGWLQ